MKNIKNSSLALLAIGILIISTTTIHAQSKEGRIAFGIDAGGNKYYGNFTDNQFAFSGDAFIRWNILDWLSLHAAYNAGQIHIGVAPNGQNVLSNPAYFGAPDATTYPGTAIPRDPKNVIRFGGWELMLSANVFPSQTFVPYFIGGVEMLNFEPRTQTSDLGLPNNAAGKYSKNVVGGVMGVGFEMYISPKVTFNGKGLLHLTGTDWLDDYSNPDNYRQDAYVTMGLGFSYYIFAPDEPAAPVQNMTDRTTITHEITERTVYHTDTVFVKDPTDTVYIANPKVNTVYNFPGTLFIVNTDQFNTAEPNNASNLLRIKRLVDQCPALQVEIQGFASGEGTLERNQKLSEMRAARIRTWLIEQGVSPDKITGTVGYGISNQAVTERTDVSASELEAARVQNRRVAVKVVRACN